MRVGTSCNLDGLKASRTEGVSVEFVLEQVGVELNGVSFPERSGIAIVQLTCYLSLHVDRLLSGLWLDLRDRCSFGLRGVKGCSAGRSRREFAQR